MDVMQKSTAHEAVYLLTAEQITKEMRFSEFEAVLDRYISVPEFGNKVVKGIYVAVDAELQPIAGVLFALPFDGKGLADPKWHLNLTSLVKHAAIKIANFPVVERESYQGDKRDRGLLWSPKSQQAGEKVVSLVLSRLAENQLGLKVAKKVTEVHVEPTVSAAQAPAQWQEVELQLRQQKDALQARVSELEEKIQAEQGKNLSLERHYQKFIQEKDEKLALLNQKLSGSKQEAEAHAKLSARSQARLVEAEEALESITERYESILAEQSEKLQQLEDKNDQDLISKLKKQNNRLSIDREYFDGMRQKLEQQLAHSREQLQDAIEQSAEGLLKRLQGSDVEMVVYQPGAGHTAIPPKRLIDYLDDPYAWAAEHCGVSRAHYLAWLEHFDRPVCQECGKPAQRVSSPIDFDPQKDTYCSLHKQAL